MSTIKKGWKQPFFTAPNAIFESQYLTAHEKLIYLYLCRRADGEGQSFPSYARMGEECGISRRMAIKVVQGLRYCKRKKC